MTKQFLIAALLAASFSAQPFEAAEAGPIRDRLKSAASTTVQIARLGADKTRCLLKGKRGTFIC